MKPKAVKERILKRIFDIVVSFLALACLSPFLLLIALLLKIEGLFKPEFRGPIFYREIRMSKGKPFKIFKFRTVKQEFLKILAKEPQRSITEFTSRKDKNSYLTPIGVLLAKIYFDEIPQLFNVLKGEMSLVGPRPHIPKQYEGDLKAGAVSARYIKAGVMGLMQASKGNPKLRATFVRMASRHAPPDKTLALISRLYFQKYLRASAFEMLFYDIGIIIRCLVVVLQAKGF